MKNRLATIVGMIVSITGALFTGPHIAPAAPASPAAGECPYRIPDAIFEDIADSIVLGDGEYYMGQTSALIQFDLTSKSSGVLQKVAIALTGSQLYEFPVSTNFTTTALPQITIQDGGMIINAIDPANQDPCY